MAEPETLTFKTEEERQKAFTAIEEKAGGPTAADTDEIDRIMEAEIVSGEVEPSPEEPVVESTQEQPPVVEEKPLEPKDETRNLVVTEDIISKYDEEYTDEHGRKRPFVTQKNADDFVKSYVHSEKNNQYLKNVRIPQEFEAGKKKGMEAAKVEYGEKLTALQKELDEIKAKPVAQPQAAPPPVVSDHQTQLNGVMTELGNIAEGDEVEHIDKLKNAIFLQQKVMGENAATYADNINNIKTELEAKNNARFDQFTANFDSKQEAITKAAETTAAQAKAQQNWNNVMSEIDIFAASNEAPAEVKTNQKYSDMYEDAKTFHNQLTEAYTGQTRSDYTPEDWENKKEVIATMWLNKVPELVGKVNSYGIAEPDNYKAWVKLDQIDAIRTGYWRNPQSNQWEKRYGTDGKLVNLGDMNTAYNYLLDNTGERERLIKEGKRKEVDSVVGAVNKRDKGVVQLDESQMGQKGDEVITEDAAITIINTISAEYAMREYRIGNPEPLTKLNAATKRLNPDNEPINPEEF